MAQEEVIELLPSKCHPADGARVIIGTRGIVVSCNGLGGCCPTSILAEPTREAARRAWNRAMAQEEVKLAAEREIAREVTDVPLGGPHMTEARARQILGKAIQPNGQLFSKYIVWPMYERVQLGAQDGAGLFTADTLEAIAWWMRNKGGK